jgi:hypothetical protein
MADGMNVVPRHSVFVSAAKDRRIDLLIGARHSEFLLCSWKYAYCPGLQHVFVLSSRARSLNWRLASVFGVA